MATQHVLVLGRGFAGLWSAVGAARKLDELGIPPDAVALTLVNRKSSPCTVWCGACGQSILSS